MIHSVRRTVSFLLIAVFLALACPGGLVRAELAFSVTLPETVKGYKPCEILVYAPVAGKLTLELLDDLKNCWLTLEEQVPEGESVIGWNGLGTYDERMLGGPYTFLAVLEGEDGSEKHAKARFEINGTTPTLVFALPSSDTLYLDHGERWFVECFVTIKCLVAMEIRDSAGQLVYTKEMTISDPEAVPVRWAGKTNDNQTVKPGTYTVKMWSKLNPSYATEFTLKVEEKYPYSSEVTVTGPIIPERGMTEEEIWEIMMKPSVVIDGNGTFRRFDLHKTMNTGSRSVGSLRCATQGLEVLDIQGKWAHVRAWNHADGKEVTGYLLLRQLTVYPPAPHYGVLIDKRYQTLTVYEDGKAIGTIPVSTGLVVGKNYYRETPAGAFLTDVHHAASFAQEGYRYEYPLKYDAGNMIHGAGYVRTGRARDYSDTLPKLGQKASHGCTRVSPFATELFPINMYWLWIHLPYHTRIIVLDD